MRRFSFSGLRARLLLLVLFSVVPALGLILYTALEQWRLAAARVPEHAARLTQIISSNQERLIEGARQVLVTVAQLPEVRGGDSSACSRLFADLLKRHSLYSNFGASRPNGDLFCSALPINRPINLADRTYFQRAIKMRDFAVGDYQIGRATGTPSINFGYPVLDDAGQIQAVIFVALDLSWLNRLVAEALLPLGATLSVIDHKGTILARHPEPEKWVGKSVPEAAVAEAILTRQDEGTAKVTGMDGVARLYAFMRQEAAQQNSSTYVSVGVPTKIVFADVDRILVRNLAGLALVGLLAIVAAWVAGNLFVVHPVNVLVSTAKRLSAGDLSARTGLPHGRGELSLLACVFDEMADALQMRVAGQRAAEARFASILDIAADAIITINENQQVTLFNQGAEKIFGYEAKQVLGQALDLLLPLRFTETHREHIRAFAEAPETSRRMGERREIFGRRRDGTEFPAEASISRLMQDGKAIFTVILRDGTERKQAEERIQRNLARIQALREIEQAITSTLDLHKVLDVLLEKIDLVLPYAVATIRLFNKESGLLEPLASRNIDEQEWRAEPWRGGRGIQRLVFESKAPQTIRYVQTDPRMRDHEFFRKYGLVSCLGVPLVVKDEALGALSFYTKEEHDFTDEEIGFLTTLASQAAITIYNARLYEEARSREIQLQETNRMLSALHEVATAASESLDLDRIFQAAIEKITEMFHFDATRVHIRDERTGEVVLKASFSNDPERFSVAPSFRKGQGIVGRVAESGKPMIFEDIEIDPLYQSASRSKVSRQFGCHFFAVFPLRGKLKNLGTLGCSGTAPRKLSAGEIQLLEAIADRIAVAIENSQLYGDVRQKVQDLQQKTAELERANQVKDEFLSVMSHELRTPLNVVMGYTGMVSEGVLGEVNSKQKSALEKVISRSQDLLSMITGILYATSIEANKVRLAPQRFPLGDLVEEIKAAYEMPRSKPVTLSWSYPPDLPAVETDREKLKHVVQNIIDNALKFTEQGHVVVSVKVKGKSLPQAMVNDHPSAIRQQQTKNSQDGEFVEFKIADTGVGIPKEKIPIIFEKFRQADSSETRSYGGVGLGLYIARRSTELLGGKVEVETEVGKGSTFTVTIPRLSMNTRKKNERQPAARDGQEFMAPSPATSNLRSERG